MEYKINIENSPNKELSSKTKKNLEEKITLKNGTNGRSLKKSKDLIETNEIGNLIVENSHDGILIVGSNYKIEFINNQLCGLIGYQREEILNQDFRLLFQSDNKEEIMELYKSHLAGKNKNPDFHLHLKTKDNIEKIFDIKAVLYNDKLGATKTLAQFKDITESKQAELLLKQSEEKFRSIVENSHNGILIVDNNFHLEYVNEKFCEILKSTKEKLIGSDFRAFLSKDSLALVVERYEKRQRGIKTPSEYEINIVCDDGEVKAVKLNSNSISIANSPKTIAQILDITLSKKKEKLQNVLLKISQAVNEVNNLRGFLEIVRFKLNNIIDTKNFYVALYDSSSDTYTFPYHEDEFDKIDDFSQLDLKNSLTDFVRRKNQAILVDEKTQLLLEEQGEIEGVVGNICPIWIGAPLVVDNVVVGVIGLQNYHHANTYSLDDLELLKIVSENVSSAIWKKQIIDKLTERELRYRDFISRSSEGIYRLDFNPPVDTTLPVKEQVDLILKNSSIGECNDMFAQMYDVENPEKLIGQSLINFYHDSIEEEDENYKSNLTFVQNNYKIINSLTEEINSKGEKIYLLNNSVGVVKNGFLEHAWGIQRDITEKKIYEDVLRQIAEGIYSTMDDFFFNSLVKFLGKSLSVDYAIIAKLDYNKVQASTLACWNKDKIVENFNFKIKGSPCEIVIANGEASYLQNVSTLFPNDSFLQENIYHGYLGRVLTDSQNNIIGVIVILYKEEIKNFELAQSVLKIFASRSSAEIERLKYVEELVKSKELAERSDILKSEFLAQMSHEIRTPVNTILSFSSLIRDSLEDKLDEDLKDSFKMIDNGGRRLIRTIDLILNVSQIQSGNLIITPVKLNITDLLKEIIAEFTREAKKKNIRINFETENENLIVEGDSYTTTQIFANLIHNAIKYTLKGSISIKVIQTANKNVEVNVIDSGVGMNMDFLNRIFDPFSQEETGYTRKFEGTGLGLTLVKKYCELNNSKISVKSKKNVGSTFIVEFEKVN